MKRLEVILKRLYKALNVTKDADFCERYDIKRSTLSTWKSRNSIPYELLEHFSQNEDISLDWLLTGKGNMYLSENNENNEENYLIDKLSLQASAGSGITNFEVEVEEKLSISKTFFKTPQNPQKLKAIEIVGDSMEPTLLNGSYIVIDTSKKGGIDGIYALLLQDEVLVKRLQFNLDQTIDIISDNPAYKPQKYNPTETQVELKILGMKILTIQ